jgi:hypothetical protein
LDPIDVHIVFRVVGANQIEYERPVLVIDTELTWGTSAEKVTVDPTTRRKHRTSQNGI